MSKLTWLGVTIWGEQESCAGVRNASWPGTGDKSVFYGHAGGLNKNISPLPSF